MRGDARTDSDIDLLIEFAPDAEPSLLTLSGLQLDLTDALGRPVDLGERRALRPRVAEAAEREMGPRLQMVRRSTAERLLDIHAAATGSA